MNNNNVSHHQETAKHFLDSIQPQQVNVEMILIEYMIRAIQKISLH